MRYLALDWGTVRIGAAVSDPDGKFAFPLDKYIDNKNAIEQIKKLILELQIDMVVIGMPTGLSGQSTTSTSEAKAFIQQITDQTSVKIELVDERLSSVAAGKELTGMGYNEKEQRSMKDNLAAQMLLQLYLDKKNK